MKRERMRARGPRGTRGIVEMVREQVGVMMESMGRVSKAVDGLRGATEALRDDVASLGGMMQTLAESADDHENRLAAIEKKMSGKPGKP